MRRHGGATSAPDYFEPVVGWRCWTVVRNGPRFRLRSIAFTDVWPVDEAFVARCYESVRRFPLRRSGWQRQHLPAVLECDCGIHAARDLEAAAAYLDLYDDISQRSVCHRAFGRVALWGTVVEGELGWRASHAYPRRILLPQNGTKGGSTLPEIANGLSAYGVPVEVLDAEDTASLRAGWSGSCSEKTAISLARGSAAL
ncbi:MAG: hypothetical protein ACJ74M_02970 [Gaiellaceae bacterium]